MLELYKYKTFNYDFSFCLIRCNSLILPCSLLTMKSFDGVRIANVINESGHHGFQ